MKILAIETSCDETAAAVVEDGTKILSNAVASSVKVHTKTGGIIPEQAARQQVKAMMPVVQQAISEAELQVSDIDSIAVTAGPGLIGSLLVGVETAKTLAFLWQKPIVPVNHLVGHLYANFIDESPKFPALGLVVSGGHTDLVLMKKHGNIKWLGGTRDDAAGEAFDKTARLLSLPYPGGPEISKLADSLQTTNHSKLKMFPRPLINSDDFDFSFSGLKTSVANKLTKKLTSHASTPQLAAEVQEAIVDVLVTKSIRAIKKYQPKSFLLAGGVAANKRLRERFHGELKSKDLSAHFYVPAPKLCTDNAAYIASFAYFNYQPVTWQKITASPQLTITD